MNAMLQHVDMATPIVTRLLMIALFPLSAFDTVAHWGVVTTEAKGRYGWLGISLVAASVIVQLVGFICILITWHERLAAVVLAVFCLLTAFLFHQFWAEDGYWTPTGGRARVEFWEFLKDVSVAGGLLLYATMAGSMPISAMLGDMMR